jgi:D-methionine transport system ATP-binding protein
MTASGAPPLVQIRDLSFTYPSSDAEVLRIPAINITGRGLIALTGPSGAGKSTLIELMAGTLREPYDGSLKVLGQEWRDLRSDAERQRHLRRIGLIPQDYGLLTTRSPRQMLEQDLADAQVPPAARRERINSSLSAVEMYEFADRQIGQLSGGQRQRVAIARMLARDVELVIADEPTANLDRELTMQTLVILGQLAQKVPVLVITHEPEVAEACDRTIVLQALAAPTHQPPTAVTTRRHRGRWVAIGAVVVAAASVALAAVAIADHRSTPQLRAATTGPTNSHSAPATARSTPAATTSAPTTRRPVTSAVTPAATAAAAQSVTPAMLLEAGACAAPCTITGRVPFVDPVGGPSTLVTVLDSSKGPYGENPGNAYIAAVSRGQVTWKYQLPGSVWWQVAPVSRPIDNTGHIFINYNPGRYNGVIILDPTGDGFDDYGSLPPGQDPIGWRFYSAAAVDPSHSGTYEIQTTINNCVPSCAQGAETQSFWRWNGTDYVK